MSQFNGFVRSGNTRPLFLGAAMLLLLALLLHLGVQPLYLEEPRRSLIAMEMLENGNFIVPTQLGEWYYKKPPFFNWVLLAFAGTLGGFEAFVLRLPTVISTLGIGVLMFLAGRRYVNESFGWYSAFLFCLSGGILFYFSSLAEIDLFYSFITFAGILAVFHFYQQHRPYLLFLSTYFLGAVGTLTKGLPSLFFIIISLIVFFVYQRATRKLLSRAHMAGLLLYTIIIGGYLYLYARSAPIDQLLQTFWGESSERTVLESGWWSFIQHLIQFPLDTLKDTLPGVIILVFAVRKDFLRQIRNNELVVFSLLMFVANILIYWLSPGSRQRYIYMLYPFLFFVLVYFYQLGRNQRDGRFKIFRTLSLICAGALTLAMPALPFVPALEFLPYLLPLSIIGFFMAISIFYMMLRQPARTLYWLIVATIMARIVFDLTILPQRAHDTQAQTDRDTAHLIANITKETPLYIWAEGRISFTTVFYLNKIRHRTLRRTNRLEKGAFYLVANTDRGVFGGVEPLLIIDYKGEDYLLVRWE